MSKKGHDSLFIWWLFGTLLFILAVPLALFAEDRTDDDYLLEHGQRRTCPFCAEVIRLDAVVCRYCGRDIPEMGLPIRPTPNDPLERKLIIALLQAGGEEVTTSQAARSIGKSLPSTESALWNLEQRGLVAHTKLALSPEILWRICTLELPQPRGDET